MFFYSDGASFYLPALNSVFHTAAPCPCLNFRQCVWTIFVVLFAVEFESGWLDAGLVILTHKNANKALLGWRMKFKAGSLRLLKGPI